MSRYKFAEIHCDVRLFIKTVAEQEIHIPFKHDDYLQGPFLRMTECIEEGKRQGWKVKRIQGVRYDFCPACANKIDAMRLSDACN